MTDIDRLMERLRDHPLDFCRDAADALAALREEARRERHAAEMCQKANAAMAEEHIALREDKAVLQERLDIANTWLRARTQERDRLREAIASMLEQADYGPAFCMGEERTGQKVWKGSFIARMEALRAALAATGEEGR